MLWPWTAAWHIKRIIRLMKITYPGRAGPSDSPNLLWVLQSSHHGAKRSAAHLINAVCTEHHVELSS
jgi:hypothetical protein